ncbi:MAG: IspD/TarI family cytidylyltransferase, partial [Phycisphaerales bacterium]
MSDIQLTVIIPAAGRGARFGGDKLSEELGGRPVLLRTVEFFAKRDDVHQIIVAGPAESDGSVDAAFESRFGPALSFLGVKTVAGGTERTDSVRAALHALDDSCTHVAVHDAARPLIDDALM